MTSAPIQLSIDGHQLAAVCLNPGTPGEPVILIHGITDTIYSWQVNPASYFLDIGPCYALSLPGHYPAVAPVGFKNAPLTAEILVNLLDDAIRQLVGDRPVTLVGHSTGGFAALALAAHRPQMARRVVSISGFAQGRWTGILGLYQRVVRLGWPGETYFKIMYNLLKLHPSLFHWALRFYVADTRALYAHPDLPKMIEQNFPSFQQIDLNAILPYFKSMPQIDICSQLSRIQAPTLVLAGDADSTVPPAQSRLIAEHIPQANLVMLAGAGHLPFFERPDEYNQQISTWLTR